MKRSEKKRYRLAKDPTFCTFELIWPAVSEYTARERSFVLAHPRKENMYGKTELLHLISVHATSLLMRIPCVHEYTENSCRDVVCLFCKAEMRKIYHVQLREVIFCQ